MRMVGRRIVPLLLPLLLPFFAAACATTTRDPVARVQAYRAARARHDVAAEATFLAPDARMFFEKRRGHGTPLKPGGDDRYAHWDAVFHSTSTATDWSRQGNEVSAVIHETNDFYKLLDWTPQPYRMTWTFDEQGRITAALLESDSGPNTGRLEEFKAWASTHHPEELAYLMPLGRLDPTDDRPERWKKILEEWRASRRPL